MLTALATLFVAVVPGAVLAFVFPPGRSRWLVWAASPVLTLGLISVGLAWLPALGLPSGAGAILVLELVLVVAAIAAARLFDRSRAAKSAPDQRSTPDGAAQVRNRWWAGVRRGSKLPAPVDLVAVAVPCAITVLLAELIMSGFRYPPGWDAQNHAFLTRNILRTGSTRMDSVCTDGTTLAHASCHFYPLAMDASWAQVVSLVGGPVSGAMMVWCVILAPLTIVVAVYAVVRSSGGGAIVAGCAATAPALIGPMWVTQAVGRIPEVAAPGLAVVVAVLFAAAVRGTHPIRMGMLAGLGMTGVLIAHTYDVLFAATLAVALVLSAGARLQKRPAVRATAAAVAATVVTVLPFIGVLVGAKGERAQGPPVYVGNLVGALRFWVIDLRTYALFGVPNAGIAASHLGSVAVQIGLWVTVPCLLVSPLCLFIPRLRWARPWLAMWVLWIAVGMWTTTSNSKAATTLAGLWYGVRGRLQTLMLPTLPLLAVAGACVIGSGLRWCVDRRTRHPTGSRRSGPFGRRLGRRGTDRAGPGPGWAGTGTRPPTPCPPARLAGRADTARRRLPPHVRLARTPRSGRGTATPPTVTATTERGRTPITAPRCCSGSRCWCRRTSKTAASGCRHGNGS